MDIKEFAHRCGMVMSSCDEDGWGGAVASYTKDSPDCHFCGYETEDAAIRAWLQMTFGDSTAEVLLFLLEHQHNDDGAN